MFEWTKLMRKPVVSIDPDSTVQQAAEAMLHSKVGVLVVSQNNQIIGILSERDVVRRAIADHKGPDQTRVKDIMTRSAITLEELSHTEEALRLMHHGNFRHLPVVNTKHEAIGMVSVRDLLRKRIEDLNRENERLSALLESGDF